MCYRTWFNYDIQSSLFTDCVKYNVFHKDRFDKNGDGVALLIKNN